MRDSLWLLPATDAAIYEQDLQRAKEYRERYEASVFCQSADLHRYNAAIAVLEGDHVTAAREMDQVRESFSDLLSPGYEPWYRSELEVLHRRITDANGSQPMASE